MVGGDSGGERDTAHRPYCFLSVWWRCAASGLAGLAQLGSVSSERIAMRIEQTE